MTRRLITAGLATLLLWALLWALIAAPDTLLGVVRP